MPTAAIRRWRLALQNTWPQTFISTNLERRFDASSYAATFLEQTTRKDERKARGPNSSSTSTHGRSKSSTLTKNEPRRKFAGVYGAVAKAEQERIKAEANYVEIKQETCRVRGNYLSKSLASFRETKAKLEAEYQDQLKIYKPGFPKMQQIQSQIDELDKRIKAESKSVTDSIEGYPRAAFEAAKLKKTSFGRGPMR